MNRTAAPTHPSRYRATANLAAVLETQGRKQTWLAARVNISEALLYKIVAGAKTADHGLADRIADALGVPFALLFALRERSDADSPQEQES